MHRVLTKPISGPATTLQIARDLELDADRLRSLVERLCAIGSSPLGFRVAGTPEDRAAAELVTAELAEIGLDGVAIEEVAVDGWRFEGAQVELGGATYDASSWGGMPPTPRGGIAAPLVDVGTARRVGLDRLDLDGRIALLDWRGPTIEPNDLALELGLRGVVAIVMSCPEGGDWFQSDGALGAFGAAWYDEAPPMVQVVREDAARLRAATAAAAVAQADPPVVRVELRAQLTRGAAGCNAVGFLAGARPGPIVASAHHDAWFSGAFDNATGVAMLIEIARALKTAGVELDHTICFSSTTAEEYGVAGSGIDSCIGAWRQATVTHPEWREEAPFHLCIEASGHPDLPLAANAPLELSSWLRRLCRTGVREGWLTGGVRHERASPGTDQWPLQLAGIPGIALLNWDSRFPRGSYHTPLDTPAIVDFELLERMTRFYAWVLLEADRDPDAIVDHAARAEHLQKALARLGPEADGLRAAARRHGDRRGRAAYTRTTALNALRARGGLAYPHEQAQADAELLEQALTQLRAGERGRALRLLRKVSENCLAPFLSQRALAIREARWLRDRDGGEWGAACHLTVGPDLSSELASLRRERGARPPGEWIEQSLERHLEHAREQVRDRLAAAARGLEEPSVHVDDRGSSHR